MLKLAQPRFIYITGCDGTGKTTQARLLVAGLRSTGAKVRHVWLRFPFFIGLPLLAYARGRGYSWYEASDDVLHGYWDFRQSWMLRRMLPWALLLDAAVAAVMSIDLPLWFGRAVVCERFVLDMLVDLAVAMGDDPLWQRLPGRLFRRLLPTDAVIIILDAEAETIRSRRADLRGDRQLDGRLKAYRQMACEMDLPLLSSEQAIAEVQARIGALCTAASTRAGAAGYAKVESKLLRHLLRNPLVAIASHWAFQSLFYMDPTERWFKLGLDLGATAVGTAVFRNWLPWYLAVGAAFVIAHTLNAVFNGHVWGALKHYGLVKHSWVQFEMYVSGLGQRIRRQPHVQNAVICGSLSRQGWTTTSDLDVRLIRRPGLWNGLSACWFATCERCRAFVTVFPLDLYVLDHDKGLTQPGDRNARAGVSNINPDSMASALRMDDRVGGC